MSTRGWIPGDFWRVCDVCGFDYRASQTYRRWDGLIVCEADFETRHPQDFVRARVDRQSVPDPRPPPPEVFVGPAEGASIFVYPGSSNFLVDDGQVRVFASTHTVTAADL